MSAGDVSKTDDEKFQETDLEKGTKTDDQKLEGDAGKQSSPEPEYTPPESASSWATMDEANGHTDKPPSGAKDDNETTPVTADNSKEGTMAENETKPTEEVTNQSPEETTTDTADATEEIKTPEETTDKTDTPEQAPENSTDQTQDEASKTDETEVRTEDDQPPSEPVPESSGDKENEDKTEQPEPETNNAGTEAEVAKAKEETLIAKESLDKKIQENEELQDELKSALSNQETEAEAYKKMTEENARLQKHHDDIKEKYEEIEGGHVLLMAELDTLKKVNGEQKDEIRRLETEVKFLKETQGGDDAVRDLQDKLIRMSNEQEEKDKKIHSLEGQLDATNHKLTEAEARAARGGSSTGEAPKSKTCAIM